MGRTIKQLRAGELLFTDENILEVIRIYLFLNRDKMIRESAEDRRWDLRVAAQDIFTGNDDMLEWLERESVECEEWLVSAMQDQERFKGRSWKRNNAAKSFAAFWKMPYQNLKERQRPPSAQTEITNPASDSRCPLSAPFCFSRNTKQVVRARPGRAQHLML